MPDARIVLITGTSSGIGLATAVAAAGAGQHVVATMRDTTRSAALLEAAKRAGVAGNVEVRALDVTDPAAADSVVAGIVADHGRLDAVVNNAGAGHVGTLEDESVEEVRSVMEVNFFGVLHVTRAALPHLRASGGRVVTVTSVGGVVGQPFNEAYCAAKFAVEGFMESLAPVAATTGVSVCLVEPGPVASEFVRNVGVDVERPAPTGPYSSALAAYLERAAGAFEAAQTPAEAAGPIVEALGAEAPAFRIQTSEAARGFVGTKLADLDGSAVQAMTRSWVS